LWEGITYCLIVYHAEAELYYYAAGILTPTGSMTAGRVDHTATLLANGKVLIAGGDIDNADYSTTILSSVELYDTGSGKFTTATSLIVARAKHTATVLQDNTVLIAGGSGTTPASAELYHPDTGEFVPTGFLKTLRARHTATLLPTGQVLIAGGDATTESGAPLASAELYDPISGTFRDVGTAPSGQFDAGSGVGRLDAPSSGQVDSGSGDGAMDYHPVGRVDAGSPNSGVDAPSPGQVDTRGGDGGAYPVSDAPGVDNRATGAD
jgi:hypothetical protein